MKVLFGMTWHMARVFMLLNRGLSGLYFILKVALALIFIHWKVNRKVTQFDVHCHQENRSADALRL
jgi:hypothetical protein